ncbi:MAG: energy transducer TonB [Bacteroidia bacterium]|nr:MAG: energy transducer TonB [Bacteroidia bacterium]
MIMMTKKKSGKFAGLKLLLLLPLITVFFILFSCTNNEKGQLDTVNEPDTSIDEVVVVASKETSLKLVQEEQPWTVVEEMPTFDGGDINKYRQWVQMNVKYPKIAVENGIMGKVQVAFVINTDGSISDAAITKGVDPSLDDEVIRIISSSPDWVAGKNEGKEVRVKMSMSINFQLQ